MWRVGLVLCACLQIWCVAALSGRQKMAIFQRNSCQGSTATQCSSTAGGSREAPLHVQKSHMRLMAKARSDNGEEGKPKKKSAAKKKKKAAAKTKVDPIEAGLDMESDLVATPIDSDLDELLSEDFGGLLKDLDDNGAKAAPKKRGRKKKEDAALKDVSTDLSKDGLDDFPSDLDIDLDLTEKDIEQALAGIESGDFDVLKFLSDNDSEKSSDGGDPILKVEAGDPNFSSELLNTLTAETSEGVEGAMPSTSEERSRRRE